jgi:alcohol dehydrogenase class IV
MKLIHSDKKGKVFLGSNFEFDLNTIFNKAKLKRKAAILVTGMKHFAETRYSKQLENVFTRYEIIIVKHIKIEPNPNELFIVQVMSKLAKKFDLILAVGGGSAIDAGKLIKNRFNNSAKLVAIYTLPGSATIVSPFAVFDNDEFKIGIAADNLIPNYSYINAQFIKSIGIDRKIIAVSDIFSHAIESFYSTASNNISRTRSKKALQILTVSKIEQLHLDGFIKADIYAGLAERVGLVLFPHAAGHYLTYKFHIPHSIATMYFLLQYLNLLLKKGVNINPKYIQYAEYLYGLLRKKRLMRKINLSNDEIVELFNLTHKYMNFAYENAPVEIKQGEYKIILEKLCPKV